MPYLPSQARLKSDAYRKILDADIIEQDEILRDLIAKQQVSGSIDANNPTRDEDGFLVSIEDPRNPGQTAEGITESVRIENKQQFFNDTYLGNIDQEFSHFTPPSIVDPTNFQGKKPPKMGGIPNRTGDARTTADIARDMIDERVTEEAGQQVGALTPQEKTDILINILNKDS